MTLGLEFAHSLSISRAPRCCGTVRCSFTVLRIAREVDVASTSVLLHVGSYGFLK